MINSRRVTWARYVESMGKMRNTYKISFRKPQEKKGFGILMAR
jgi:hypothetical protein